jgi:hypothetical protein
MPAESLALTSRLKLPGRDFAQSSVAGLDFVSRRGGVACFKIFLTLWLVSMHICKQSGLAPGMEGFLSVGFGGRGPDTVHSGQS